MYEFKTNLISDRCVYLSQEEALLYSLIKNGRNKLLKRSLWVESV